MEEVKSNLIKKGKRFGREVVVNHFSLNTSVI